MLTPKETGGGQGGPTIYPVDIPYSALLEDGYSSTGAMAANATMALSFKPTAVDSAKPLSDPSNHYLLLIQKTGTSVEVIKNAASLGTYTTAATTYAGLLAEAVAAYCGSTDGYYSNLYVADGAALPWETFFELSGRVADLWVWKKGISLDYGPGGGYYPMTCGVATTPVNFLTGGTAYGVTELAGSEPDKIFDGLTSTTWYRTLPNLPDYVAYALPAAKRMEFYSFTRATIGGWASYPADWDIEGSNDSTDGFDGTWTTLDQRRGQIWPTANECRYFACSNPGTYKLFRVKAIKGGYGNTPVDSTFAGLGHWQGYESGTPWGLGTDFSGNDNHWTMAGTQSDDTPTHNGGVAAWEALDEPAIKDASLFADIVLRTGTGDVATIDSCRFPPDWVSIKDRGAQSWYLWDEVRGGQKAISANTADAAMTFAGGVTSFGNSGYTMGVMGGVNYNGSHFIDLALKTNPSAGFSVVAYQGDGVSGRAVQHGLGKAPTFMLVKRLDAAMHWAVYHAALGANKKLVLPGTDAALATTSWAGTEPTSTGFFVGAGDGVNASGGSYIAYIFTDSDVFKAWSFVGNGTASGPLVDLGGRPLSIPFYKAAEVGTSPWYNYDAVRSPDNPVDELLYADGAEAEVPGSEYKLQFQSNGFKALTANAGYNGNGLLHVGLAVMRQPFKYSNAF